MSDFKWRHYAGHIILWAVRSYCKYGISYRELAEMLDERGIQVSYTRVCRVCTRDGASPALVLETQLEFQWAD